MTPPPSTYALLFLASAVACGSDVSFATKYAPSFTPAHHTVSVFGVYKDGQLSSEAWGGLRPRISTAFGAPSCEAGYGGALLLADEALSTAIADYVRANGPTDRLLAQLAPASQGDLIVSFIIAGRLPVHEKVSLQEESAAAARNSRGGRGGGVFSEPGGRRRGGDDSVLQLSASLFSVTDRKSVALVDLQYSGASVDEAVAKFVERLRQSLPSATCRGWSWSGNVSPESIQKLVED